MCRVWWLPTLLWVLNPAGVASALLWPGQPHSELQGLYQVERSEGGHSKVSARGRPKELRHTHSAAPKAKQAGPSADQMDLGEGWNHVLRGGRVFKATTNPLPNPKPSHQPVTKAPSKLKMTPPGRRLGLRSPNQNLQQPLSRPLERQRRKQPRVSKRSQHGVDIRLLSETFLNPGQVFLLANYVCHHTNRRQRGR